MNAPAFAPSAAGCGCAVDGARRQAVLEIGDGGRVVTVLCPDCELPVLTPFQIESGLHAGALLVTMTTIVEPADGDDAEYTWYSLSEPPPELLATGDD